MTSVRDQLEKSRQRFWVETDKHEMTVLHNDGIYRHLRFMNPRNSGYWFELHTGPHFLLFRGDGESFVFSNGDRDMFRSFRNSIHRDGSLHPDPGYWTQKLNSAEQAQKWDDDVFRERLQEEIAYYIEQEIVPPEHAERFREEVAFWIEDEDLSTASLAIKHMSEFEFYFEQDTRKRKKNRYGFSSPDVQFDECWEWIAPCTEYDWWYLWALHAILWGILKHDQYFGLDTHSLTEGEDVSSAKEVFA